MRTGVLTNKIEFMFFSMLWGIAYLFFQVSGPNSRVHPHNHWSPKMNILYICGLGTNKKTWRMEMVIYCNINIYRQTFWEVFPSLESYPIQVSPQKQIIICTLNDRYTLIDREWWVHLSIRLPTTLKYY